jgi:hypothetical protein
MRTNPFEKYLGPEDIIHRQVCQYVKWKYRGATMHHSPNEGKRTPFERWKIEQLHCSAGFPDLIIFYKGVTIAVELKAPKNKKATPNQVAWIQTLNDNGIPAKVCVGYEEAVEFVDSHLKGLKKAS